MFNTAVTIADLPPSRGKNLESLKLDKKTEVSSGKNCEMSEISKIGIMGIRSYILSF